MISDKIVECVSYAGFFLLIKTPTFDSLQVEFSYPPLIEGNSYESHEIPEEWKHIPSLALPDGAHNYQKGWCAVNK